MSPMSMESYGLSGPARLGGWQMQLTVASDGAEVPSASTGNSWDQEPAECLATMYNGTTLQKRSTALSAHTRLKPDDSGVMVVLTSGDDTEPEDLTLAGHSSTVRCPRLHWPAPQRITKCGALAKVSRRSHMRGKGGHAESTFDRARPHHV